MSVRFSSPPDFKTGETHVRPTAWMMATALLVEGIPRAVVGGVFDGKEQKDTAAAMHFVFKALLDPMFKLAELRRGKGKLLGRMVWLGFEGGTHKHEGELREGLLGVVRSPNQSAMCLGGEPGNMGWH